MNLTLFSVSLAIYFAVHSFLADEKIKQWFHRNIISMKYYRLFFNLIAVFGVAVLIAFYFMLEEQILISRIWLKIIGASMSLIGLYWIVTALKGYNLKEFAGLEQLRDKPIGQNKILKMDGLNAQVRHPLYFGTLLIIWGMFFVFSFDASLSVTIVTTSYTYIGTLLEERKLEQQFGETYRLYQQRVPMLIPKFW